MISKLLQSGLSSNYRNEKKKSKNKNKSSTAKLHVLYRINKKTVQTSLCGIN